MAHVNDCKYQPFFVKENKRNKNSFISWNSLPYISFELCPLSYFVSRWVTRSIRQHQTIIILTRSHIFLLLPNEGYLTTVCFNVSRIYDEETNKHNHPSVVITFVSSPSKTCAACVYVTGLVSISGYDTDSIYSFESL